MTDKREAFISICNQVADLYMQEESKVNSAFSKYRVKSVNHAIMSTGEILEQLELALNEQVECSKEEFLEMLKYLAVNAVKAVMYYEEKGELYLASGKANI